MEAEPAIDVLEVGAKSGSQCAPEVFVEGNATLKVELLQVNRR